MTGKTKVGLAIGGIALAIAVGMGFLMRYPSVAFEEGWCHAGWGTLHGGWVMMILMVLFWGLAIWLIVSLVRGWAEKSEPRSLPGREESALELLKRRYAAGEISKDEYDAMKRDLK